MNVISAKTRRVVRAMFVLFVVIVFALSAGLFFWRRGEFGRAFPPEARRVLDAPDAMTLYSISAPDTRTAEPVSSGLAFEPYRILGKVAVTAPETQAALRETLYRAVRGAMPIPVLCFVPRHGLRVTRDGDTWYFLPCFQCSKMQIRHGGREWSVTMGAPANAETFNRLLRERGGPLAP